MRIFKIQSIDRVIEWSQKQGEQLFHSSKQVGTKITSFVLGCLGGNRSQGQSVRRPKTQATVLDSSKSVLRTPSPISRSPAKKRRQGLVVPGSPIGLHPCSSCSWINAWLQFVIHLPRFVELSPLASKAFDPFYLFIEQYLADQREGKRVSSADSSFLFHSLSQMLPSLLESPIHLGEVSLEFFKRVFPFPGGKSSCLVFHPDWALSLDERFQENLRSLFKKNPLEILLSVRQGQESGPFSVQRQLFPKRGGCFYDLGSFIEARFDEGQVSFITYIKVGRIWYQCDDETVRPVSSRVMGIPLQRGILFHYKRVRV